MATRLTTPVRRQVAGIEHARDLVVTLYPNKTIGLRPARCRTEHLVPLTRVYALACAVTVEALRKQKADAKAQARREKGLPPLPRKVSRGLLGAGR